MMEDRRRPWVSVWLWKWDYTTSSLWYSFAQPSHSLMLWLWKHHLTMANHMYSFKLCKNTIFIALQILYFVLSYLPFISKSFLIFSGLIWIQRIYDRSVDHCCIFSLSIEFESTDGSLQEDTWKWIHWSELGDIIWFWGRGVSDFFKWTFQPQLS